MPAPPATSTSSPRVRQIVAASRELLDEVGWQAVSMRAVADRLGIKAPSLYKHVAGKDALRVALIEQGFLELGAAIHAAAESPGTVEAVLAAYRAAATRSPELYRMATASDFPRDHLTPGLEAWAGHPFWVVTGEPHRAQALWACAHGLAILEIDRRVLPETHDLLDATWAAAAAAFSGGRVRQS